MGFNVISKICAYIDTSALRILPSHISTHEAGQCVADAFCKVYDTRIFIHAELYYLQQYLTS